MHCPGGPQGYCTREPTSSVWVREGRCSEVSSDGTCQPTANVVYGEETRQGVVKNNYAVAYGAIGQGMNRLEHGYHKLRKLE